MPDQQDSNWRTGPAFNTLYKNLSDCVKVTIDEFEKRRGTKFVLLRHQINSTWAVMPFSQWRSLSADHPAQPSTICFFGTYAEFAEICRSFPPDLFTRTTNEDDLKTIHDNGDDPLKSVTAPTDPEQAHKDFSQPSANPNDTNPENS
ncbi:MAG: hypothetical protein KAV00_12185 [Phycisphaerae bacterium]|nr:hypothetical protein [Phycisphaerae bacterium]